MKIPTCFSIFLISVVSLPLLIKGQSLETSSKSRSDVAQPEAVDFDQRLSKYLRPVEAKVSFGMSRSDAKLMRIDPIGLVTSAEGIGEQTIPLANMNGFYAIGAKTAPREFYAQLESGNVEAATEAMRREYYQLVPFVSIPEANTNLHSFIGVGIDLLLKAGELDEAIWLFEKLPVSIQTGKLASVTRDLLGVMIEQGYFQQATKLALQMPFDVANEEETAARIEIANRLRIAGSTNDARTLYAQVGDSGSRLATLANLWALYLEVESGRLDYVSSRLPALDLPEVGTDEFTLYRLIEGRVEFERSNLNESLVAFSSGIVDGSQGSASRPELLYYSHLAYGKFDIPSASQAIAAELKTLYPDSPWASRL